MWPVVLAAVGGLLLGLLGGVVIGAFGGAFVFGPETWTETATYASGTLVATLEPGTCLSDLDLSDPAVQPVACDEPHAVEAYARREALGHRDAGRPEEIDLLAEDLCRAEFDAFVGRSYWDSSLEFWAHVPDQEAWASGERDVVCVLEDLAGEPLRGTAAGSRW